MNRSTVANRWNLELIEENYQRWSGDPTSVDATWQAFFEGYEPGGRAGEAQAGCSIEGGAAQAAVTRLIDAYREIGHYLADLDPLKLTPPGDPSGLLDPSTFGLTEADLDRTFHTKLFDPPQATLRDLIAALRETYCRTIGVEFMHIRNPQVRDLAPGADGDDPEPAPSSTSARSGGSSSSSTPPSCSRPSCTPTTSGPSGSRSKAGETLIPLLDAIIERSARYGVKEIVLGMPHRGRLNVLANTLDKPYGMIFGEFEDNQPETYAGDGDVKYHLGFSADHVTADNHTVHLSLTPNPSHLEAVNPVVEGRMRAKQRRFKDRDRKLGVPVLIHGDAAFAGQGLVAETLNLSQLKGYRTGGTVHVVVNNQIGFTTSPVDSRSTRYCTDVAKMIEVPIFHVNGDDPEAVVYVAELALDFRETFGQDVVIDLVCYRKHGHNENDEPAFTQPLMYAKIQDRPTIRAIYTEKLIQSGELSAEEAETIAETFGDKLQAVYDEVHDHAAKIPPTPGLRRPVEGATSRATRSPRSTPASRSRPSSGSPGRPRPSPRGSTSTPRSSASSTPGSRRSRPARGSTGASARPWPSARSWPRGSRSGSAARTAAGGRSATATPSWSTGPTARPTSRSTPSPSRRPRSASTTACCPRPPCSGFDYGYSLDEPNMLILWEAQFGDFANGAQVIIDQFIASAESKWGRASGLVMLLPHGYEGQGPEHSSARLERFLALCAEDNIQVVNPTTPAQYFHLLRRQVKRDFRKPLIVMTPKSLLRAKQAVSLARRLRHRPVPGGDRRPGRRRPGQAGRPLLGQGLLRPGRQARGVEQGAARSPSSGSSSSTPGPPRALKAALGRYRSAREWVWCQEESQNMGGWTFVAPRLRELTGAGLPVRRPRRQRQPGHGLAHDPRPRAEGTGRGRHRGRHPAPGLGEAGPAGRRPHEQGLTRWPSCRSRSPRSASRSPRASWPAGSSPTARSSRPASRSTSWRPTRPARSSSPRPPGP